jgi:NAD+ kinase
MIGLIAHAEKPEAAGVVREMVSELELNGLPLLLHKNTAPLAGMESDLDETSLAEQCELLIVIGGDGTILRIVQRIYRLENNTQRLFGCNEMQQTLLIIQEIKML